jgi:phage I-like protein
VIKLFKNFKKSTPDFKGLYFNAIPVEETGEDGWIKIVPVGKFPVHPGGAHEILKRHIQEMAVNFTNTKKDLLFDYDHASLWGTTKAAGWSNKVEAREDGLYIQYPEFTPTAKALIENREYRYFSPVYYLNSLSRGGDEIGAQIISVALTNMPYMENEIDSIGNSQNFIKEEDMKLSPETLKGLGLPEDATPEQIENAITEQSKKINAVQAELEASKQESETLRANQTSLENRLEKLEKGDESRNSQAAETLINQAVADGKILPADRDIWLNQAKTDYENVKKALVERKVNSAMPNTMSIPPVEGKPKKEDTIKNAIQHVKELGRYPARSN